MIDKNKIKIYEVALTSRNATAKMAEARQYRNPPASYKSYVWVHFGLPVDVKVTDKAICKRCLAEVKTSGGTSNLRTHMKRHQIYDN